MKLLVGIPTKNFSTNDSFYDYLLSIDVPPGTIRSFARGQSPAANRNLLIQQALDNDCTHILFLDDDTAPGVELFNKLSSHDKDLVTGLYLMRSFPHQPILFNYAAPDGRCRHFYINEVEHTDLVPVVAAGLGAVLIKTDVFRKLEKPWIRLGELDPENWCDDIGFYRRVREAGFEMFCDLSANVGHMAQVIVMPEFRDGKWVTTLDTRGTNKVVIPQLGNSQGVAP